MPLRALEGFVVGITADRRWGEQAELLQRRGAVVLHGPTIKTEYLASDSELRAATHAVIAMRPDYLVATTGIGVRAWLEAAQAWGLAEALLEALGRTRVAARGPKASAAAQTAGLPVWSSPASERLDDVVASLLAEGMEGRTVAFQHYGQPNATAVAALEVAGASVVEVPIYRWQRPDDLSAATRLIDAVCAGSVDAVTFTSAPAVMNLMSVARDGGRDDALRYAFNEGGVVAACIGPVCAEGARSVGIDAPVAPGHGRLGLLVRALTDALATRRHSLSMAGHSVVVQGRALAVDASVVELPDRERAVLETLLLRRGAVVAKAAILRALGDDAAAGVPALEATVGRLRRRLGPAAPALKSVRARGYLLDAH
jgi:uroporphyrinogen-III synthase